MRADVIASHGRIGRVSAVQIGTFGRLARIVGAVFRDSIAAYLNGISPVITDAVEAFLAGGISLADSIDGFLSGSQAVTESVHAFVIGVSGFIATSSVAAFILGHGFIKIFERIAEMDRTFEDDTEM